VPRAGAGRFSGIGDRHRGRHGGPFLVLLAKYQELEAVWTEMGKTEHDEREFGEYGVTTREDVSRRNATQSDAGPHVNSVDHDRLIKLLGVLGSEHAGERGALLNDGADTGAGEVLSDRE
jgi:hypothetical protein